MASTTQDKTMADQDLGRDDDGQIEANAAAKGRPATAVQAAEGGFFAIYKKGQGYWTRLLTAVGAALLIGLTAHFLYTQLATFNLRGTPRDITVAAFVALAAVLAWWLMNKPDNAEFLIATDSEMKKVNWTSREDLIGSTKVVILFMFLIAFFLFVIDIVFGYLFYFIKVLKFAPLG